MRPPKVPVDTSLRAQVYDSLREALTSGKFKPGQKVTFRAVAGTQGVSLTPVREALRRLVAEGAFEMQPNRSVRVPLMTRARVLELRDLRMAVEGLAAEKAAHLATRAQVAKVRRVAHDIMVARSRGDSVLDRMKVREFHFSLYAIADQPALLRVIEGLWLQTGPYLNLLYPDYIASPRGPETPRPHHQGAAVARCGDGAPRDRRRRPARPDLCRRSRRRGGQYRPGRARADETPARPAFPIAGRRSSFGITSRGHHGPAAQQSTYRLVQRQVHAGRPGHDPLP